MRLAHARDGLLIIATPTDALRGVLQALPAGAGSPVRSSGSARASRRPSGRLAHEVVQEEIGAAGARRPAVGPELRAGGGRAVFRPRSRSRAPPAFCELRHRGAARRRAADLFERRRHRRGSRRRREERAGDRDRDLRRARTRAERTRRVDHARPRGNDATRLRARRPKPDTFMGLTGVGDLILTATGRPVAQPPGRSGTRARRGRRRARTREARPRRRGRAFGARRARAARARPGVEMPITEAVCAVLDGALSPPQALDRLLAREPKREAVQP